MLLACDPQRTLTVYLDDADDAPDRPVFTYKFLTCSQMSQRQDALTSGGGTVAEAVAVMSAVAAIGLVGWKNLRRPDGSVVEFDPAHPEAIAEALSMPELSKLLHRVTLAQQLDPDAKKN